jgi:hypothetical protein
MTTYERVRDEHWLRDKLDDGKLLILNDDSIWQVHPSDSTITARWLRGSTINVEQSQAQSYPFVLRNQTEGESARVDFLGDSRVAS